MVKPPRVGCGAIDGRAAAPSHRTGIPFARNLEWGENRMKTSVRAFGAGILILLASAGGAHARDSVGTKPTDSRAARTAPRKSGDSGIARAAQPEPKSSKASATPQAAITPIEFPAVRKVVSKYFGALPNRKASDLISRGEAREALDLVEKAGWKPLDRESILESALSDDSLLVRELRTNGGREFMRSVSSFPGAYDRLDRLTKLSDGPTLLRKVIDGPDGYKLLEYMTTTEGGAALGGMLSEAPSGSGFNEPTGRIYTSQDLLDRLKTSFESERQPPASPSGRGKRGRAPKAPSRSLDSV